MLTAHFWVYIYYLQHGLEKVGQTDVVASFKTWAAQHLLLFS